MSVIRVYLPDREVLRQWVGAHGLMAIHPPPPQGLCLCSHLKCNFVGLEEKSRQGKLTLWKILGHGKEMTVWLETLHRSDSQTNPRYWHVEQFTRIIFLTSWGRVRMLFTQDCGYNSNVSLLQDTFRVSHSPWLLHWKTPAPLTSGTLGSWLFQ